MNDMKYRIRLKRGDYEVEVEGDKSWVEDKFNELTTEGTRVSRPQEAVLTSARETLGEFLVQKGNPTKHTDLTAVFAYWLFKVNKNDSFNVNNIAECYENTRKSKPSNLNQTINQNVTRNIFTPAAEKKDGYKAWVITTTGERYVEQMA